MILAWVTGLLLAASAPKGEQKEKPNPNAIESKILFLNPIDYSCVVQTGIYSTPAVLVPATRLTSQGKEIAFSDLKVGQVVRLSTSPNGSQVVINSIEVLKPPVVRLEPVPKPKRYTVKGSINSYDPFTQLLSVSALGNTYFLSMNDKTVFKDKEGKSSEDAGMSNLTPGTLVTLTLQDFGPGRKEVVDVVID